MEESGERTRKDTLKDNGLAACLFLFSVPLLFLTASLSGLGFTETVKNVMFLLILNAVLVFYLKSSKKQFRSPSYRLTVLAGYLISFGCILSGNALNLHGLWMFGPILTAALVDTGLGLLMDLMFVFLSAGLAWTGADALIYRFVLCAVVVILARHMTDARNFLYTVVIGISCNITLLLVLADFMYEDSLTPGSGLEVLSLLLVMAAAYRIRRWSDKYSGRLLSQGAESEQAAPFRNTAEQPAVAVRNPADERTAAAVLRNTEEQPAAVGQERSAAAHPVGAAQVWNTVDSAAGKEAAAGRESAQASENGPERAVRCKKEESRLKELLLESSELLMRLKAERPDIYEHSIRVGELSALAAELIDADADVAKAGGFYHEIGRLAGKNYIREGVRLAAEHRFPKAVSDIIKQHNIKVGAPKTPEAAIVMLSDSVIASMEYLRKEADSAASGKTEKEKTSSAARPVSAERLVGGIFDARLQNGFLDHSGVSLTQYKILKSFYCSAAPKTMEG